MLFTGRQRLEYNPFRALSEPYVIVGVVGEHKLNSHMRLFLNLRTSPMYGRPAGIRYSVPYAVLTGAGRWMRGRRWRAG